MGDINKVFAAVELSDEDGNVFLKGSYNIFSNTWRQPYPWVNLIIKPLGDVSYADAPDYIADDLYTALLLFKAKGKFDDFFLKDKDSDELIILAEYCESILAVIETAKSIGMLK